MCKLEPLWLPADLVEKAEIGRAHIRLVEKELVRAGRVRVWEKRSSPGTGHHVVKYVT